MVVSGVAPQSPDLWIALASKPPRTLLYGARSDQERNHECAEVRCSPEKVVSRGSTAHLISDPSAIHSTRISSMLWQAVTAPQSCPVYSVWTQSDPFLVRIVQLAVQVLGSVLQTAAPQC
jgi:hypothetical protein